MARDLIERDGRDRGVVPAGGATFARSELVMLEAGLARTARPGVGVDAAAQAANAATCRVVGVCIGELSASGRIPVRNGVFGFKVGGGGDALTAADIERDVFVIDGDTVGKTNPNNTRPKAGVLFDIEGNIAFVKVGAAS
jgi:hypothetical protein